MEDQTEEHKLDDWQLKTIAKFHPVEETRKDAGMKLVEQYYSEDRKDVLLMIAKNKSFHVEVQKAAGFKLIETAESYSDLISLSKANVHHSVFEEAVKGIEPGAMKWIDKCLEKKEYWNLTSMYENKNLPASIMTRLEGILREKAMEFSGMDKESRDKYDAAVKGKGEKGKKTKGTVPNR